MKKPIILIVEDEPAIADNIRYALETDGFEPVWLSQGGEVLSLLANQEINLIVLDIGLPDINGFELCKEIRRSYKIPIIFLTARADEVDRVVGLEIGADDYMVKPFSPRELSARIRAVLRRSNEFPSSDKRSAGTVSFFKIDEEKMQVFYFDRLLQLSRYEYLIITTLVKHPGHVFTRERLMDIVWDEPEVSMDRTVDAHIKNIRKKLKEITEDFNPIVTHRGTGYSLKEE